MPTYVLEGGAHALLAPQPQTIRIRGVAVAVRARRDDGSEAAQVLRPGSGILVVPQLPEALVVRVEPIGTEQFPPGTVLDVSVAPESRRDPDPDQATVSGVDVSGLAGRDLLRLEPVAGRIQVTALGIRVDTPLPPVAETVRDAARSLLHVESVPEAHTVGLSVLVDASSSTRALAETGEIASALDIVLGISRVVSGNRELTAAIGTTTHRSVSVADVTTLSATVTDAILGAPLRAGFRATAATASKDDILIVISDAPSISPVPETVRRHSLVLTPRSIWPAFQGRSSGNTFLPVAEPFGPTSDRASLSEHMLQDAALVREVTHSLLRGILRESTLGELLGASS